MSCVVGLLNNGELYMGSDGVATTDDGERRPIIATKVFTNKEYLIGFTGSVRTGQLAGPKFFEPPSNIYDIPDALRENFLEKGSLVVSNETQQHLMSSNFLIGYKGRLFEILIDFQLNEVRGDFTAIGSGATYAMGSLFATKKWNSPEKRVLNSLQAASQFDRSCGKPFTIEVMK
jgi:ATP-dependent protease HslVU (ClpYQ) peptidase subunit